MIIQGQIVADVEAVVDRYDNFKKI